MIKKEATRAKGCADKTTGGRYVFRMIPASARKAALASFEFGKAAATSGSRTITALSGAYRDANLLGAPRLKSYSGRISSALTRSAAPLLVDLFIVPFLGAGCPSGADDANRLCELDVHNGQQTPLVGNTQKYQSFSYG